MALISVSQVQRSLGDVVPPQVMQPDDSPKKACPALREPRSLIHASPVQRSLGDVVPSQVMRPDDSPKKARPSTM
ncbi:hypothetical protein NDU88_001297 [Pleurodeles waltl]|uniref:Uncharacterized protein n=1 Tax=Pleurodeles waltl TaxID=8319 RepID=A0AAV7KQM3_PLEWA|nr:hypothetical protein NDU88_001297 [Pleurodeles waltl]